MAYEGPPKDRFHLMFIIIIFQGFATLIAWNMFTIAKAYFVEYKLHGATEMASNYLAYVGWASQLPNLVFSWVNVFIVLKGALVSRILWMLIVEVFLFIFTIILAMLNSSTWPALFFWLTMISVVVLNSLNAIFQNTTFGIAAPLPPKYIGGVVLGQNTCGTMIVLLSWITDELGGSYRTAAIYFFLFGMFVLMLSFDLFLGLPLNRFYSYYHKAQASKPKTSTTPAEAKKIPYGHIFRRAKFQIFILFSIFFVTLSIYPAVHSDIHPVSPGFLGKNFVRVTCFLTFNFMAMVGNTTASLWQFPNRRWLIVFAAVRYLFIPFYLFCNYHPLGRTRFLPVLVSSDWVYWIVAVFMGWSSGHGSSLGMMYIGGTVEPEYASKAGMIGGASIMTGIMVGLLFTRVCPLIVSSAT